MKLNDDVFKIVATLLGAILLTVLIVIIISNPSRPQSNVIVTVNKTQNVDSTKLLNKATTSVKQTVDSTINNSQSIKTATPVDYSNNSNTSTIEDKVQSIAVIDKITSDDNFNTRLNITISNPYHKPLANVQLYISQDGNSYIPNDLSENSPQLLNIDLGSLPPGKAKTVSITSNDKGNKNVLYTINTRKVRFSNGELLTK